VIIVYHNHEGAGRGMVIQRSSKEFILVGVGFDVKFRHSRPSGDPAALVEANWGYFDNNSWVTLHPIAREHLESQGMPIKLIEPGVVQVILE
jgi:hypothetical protein